MHRRKSKLKRTAHPHPERVQGHVQRAYWPQERRKGYLSAPLSRLLGRGVGRYGSGRGSQRVCLGGRRVVAPSLGLSLLGRLRLVPGVAALFRRGRGVGRRRRGLGCGQLVGRRCRSASVGRATSIGRLVRVGHAASIGCLARIGRATSIGRLVRVGHAARIGCLASIGRTNLQARRLRLERTLWHLAWRYRPHRTSADAAGRIVRAALVRRRFLACSCTVCVAHLAAPALAPAHLWRL